MPKTRKKSEGLMNIMNLNSLNAFIVTLNLARGITRYHWVLAPTVWMYILLPWLPQGWSNYRKGSSERPADQGSHRTWFAKYSRLSPKPLLTFFLPMVSKCIFYEGTETHAPNCPFAIGILNARARGDYSFGIIQGIINGYKAYWNDGARS